MGHALKTMKISKFILTGSTLILMVQPAVVQSVVTD